jgi:hypothetical protein
VTKLLIWVAVIVTALFVFVRLLPDESEDSANQNAAIAVIKSSHAPSVQLLSWNPDLDDMQWRAPRCGSAILGQAISVSFAASSLCFVTD